MKYACNYQFPAVLCLSVNSQSGHVCFLLLSCHSTCECCHSSSPILHNQYTLIVQWKPLIVFSLPLGILQTHPWLVRMHLKLFWLYTNNNKKAAVTELCWFFLFHVRVHMVPSGLWKPDAWISYLSTRSPLHTLKKGMRLLFCKGPALSLSRLTRHPFHFSASQQI